MVPERRSDLVTGSFASWFWAEDWAVDLRTADVVSALRAHFIGLRGVCTSWDSMVLDPGMFGTSSWESRGGLAVSPPVDTALADSWPSSSCGWDEWYFFGEVPHFEKLQALCNWVGVSVGEAHELEEMPAGFNLQEQVALYRPRIVLGDGGRIFFVAEDPKVVAEFVGLCSRRRTTG